MRNWFAYIFTSRTVIIEDITVYVPLLPKEIPSDQLDAMIRGWFSPEEFESVQAFLDLPEAIAAQNGGRPFERFPHTEALRIIIELQVLPLSLFKDEDTGITRVDLRFAPDFMRIANVHVTARYMPGPPNTPHIPGDLPFTGEIHHTIDPSTLSLKLQPPLFPLR